MDPATQLPPIHLQVEIWCYSKWGCYKDWGTENRTLVTVKTNYNNTLEARHVQIAPRPVAPCRRAMPPRHAAMPPRRAAPRHLRRTATAHGCDMTATPRTLQFTRRARAARRFGVA